MHREHAWAARVKALIPAQEAAPYPVIEVRRGAGSAAGGLGSGKMFGPVLPSLAERHHVIVVDLQGHGRTADIDQPRRSARRPKVRSPPPLSAEVEKPAVPALAGCVQAKPG